MVCFASGGEKGRWVEVEGRGHWVERHSGESPRMVGLPGLRWPAGLQLGEQPNLQQAGHQSTQMVDLPDQHCTCRRWGASCRAPSRRAASRRSSSHR
eukprot:scaffold8901_cov115-Isochrysis_galbana.AAC.4